MAIHIRRREFVFTLGGAAAAWSLAARAQQAAIPVIGFLHPASPVAWADPLRGLHRGLNDAGFVEGENVAIVYRWAEDHLDRLPGLVADLIRHQVAVIVGNHTAALVAKAATTTVPIVFASGSDPVRDRLVASLNRPGGNVTGVSFLAGELGAKRLELLRQLVPKAATIAVLVNASTPDTEAERTDVEAAAQAVGQRTLVVDVADHRDIEAAFATFVRGGAGALLVGTGAFTNSHRERIVALAARHALPGIYSSGRFFTEIGGLMSYSPSIIDAYRQAGVYTGRILKGERPADLPVMLPTKFELVINLKTAKALNLDVPDRLLALADEVIE